MGAIITASWQHEQPVCATTGDDGDPFFTAALFYEPAVKITFTNGWTYAAAQ